jgi:sigma-B regulation protein RsbU (phosphoserine phosphatase)
MFAESNLIATLSLLNHISETLNQAVDVRSVLDDALADLIELMGLETGWIFLRDPVAQERWWGSGYVLAAHHNLPPAMDLKNPEAWDHSCNCQGLCDGGQLTNAYNEVRCSRLAMVQGDRHGLALHASAPLRSGEQILGILNVAAPDWASFSPEALTLLSNVGNQIGVALERARLFDLLQEQRIQEQATLLEFSNQLLGRLDLTDLMAYLVEEIRKMLGVDACALLLPVDRPGFLDFGAASGWNSDPVASGRQAPADEESSLGQVMLRQQLLLAEDIETENPTPSLRDWLIEEGFHGYAVAPLVAAGRSIGALMLSTRQPRRLAEQEVRLLRLMANQAAIAIEKARLHEEEVKTQVMERELDLGRQIQLSLLPPDCPIVPGWQCTVFYQAARQVGGDFYDFFDLPGKPARMGIVIADVVGKGVPAALLMAASGTIIRATALAERSPAAVLMQANELLRQSSRSGLFLTGLYAELHSNSGRLIYANAGHNWPLWYQSATGRIQMLADHGTVLGAFDQIDLEDCEIELAHNDLLVLYTDGVTEAMDEVHQLFGEERLRAAVAANATGSAQQVLDAIVAAVRTFTGGIPQSDDITLSVLKRGS